MTEGDDRAEQDGAEQDGAEQDGAEQDGAEQDGAEQDGVARERLEHERDRVGGLISELRSEGLDEEQAAQSGDLTHYDQHPADQASEMFEREKDLAILEALEVDLAEIEAALQRLDEGTYGVDEITGDRIDPDRLEALPTARTNVPTDNQ